MPSGADTFTFLGPDAEIAYFKYRDASTGSMLTGRPGYTCPIVATDTGPPDEDGNPTALPVPPDGRWVPSGSPDAKAAVAVAEAGRAAQEAPITQDAAPPKAGKVKGDTGEAAGASAQGGE